MVLKKHICDMNKTRKLGAKDKQKRKKKYEVVRNRESDANKEHYTVEINDTTLEDADGNPYMFLTHKEAQEHIDNT